MMLGLGSFPLLEMCDVMCEDVKHDSILCFFCFPFFKSMEKNIYAASYAKGKKNSPVWCQWNIVDSRAKLEVKRSL